MKLELASIIYWIALFIILGILMLVGLLDICLYQQPGKMTISDYLRENPMAYIIPIILTIIFWFTLAFHLFVQDSGD